VLTPGFEWLPPHYSGALVYAFCRRCGMDGEWPYPHHGQWGATLPLAMCGAGLAETQRPSGGSGSADPLRLVCVLVSQFR
jgi:hypothetical protein